MDELIYRQRADEIAKREEAEGFVSLVQEYADMGYSQFAVAFRLLGIHQCTLARYLAAHGASISFKRKGEDGYQHWDDVNETRQKIRDARLSRGNLRMITFNGETRHLKDWSRITGINATTIARRIDVYGWPVDRALTVKARAEMRSKRPSSAPINERQREAMGRMWASGGSW